MRTWATCCHIFGLLGLCLRTDMGTIIDRTSIKQVALKLACASVVATMSACVADEAEGVEDTSSVGQAVTGVQNSKTRVPSARVGKDQSSRSCRFLDGDGALAERFAPRPRTIAAAHDAMIDFTSY